MISTITTKNSKTINSGTVDDIKFCIKFTFLTIILFLTFPITASSTLADMNLVSNPSFEKGSIRPLNWTFVTNSGNTPFWDTISHSGARSVRVQIGGTRNKISGNLQSDLISAQPLSNYTLSAWGMTKNTGGTIAPAVRVVELDANKKTIGQTSLVFSKGTNNWLQKTIDFKTGTYTRYLYVYANIRYGYGTFWVDDVKLNLKSIPTPTPTPTPNTNNWPVGGGVGYKNIVAQNNANIKYIQNNASNRTVFLSVLASSKSGDIIYIDDSVRMDLSGYDGISIPAGVTLASGRGNGSSKGALLFDTDLQNSISGLFVPAGDGVRITGLRIQGPDQIIGTSEYWRPEGYGIFSQYYIEVDNNEIFGWAQCGVCLFYTNISTFGTPYIHNNYIHHNIRYGLGYGVQVAYGGNALIESNLFDWNRHDIAGWGTPNEFYIARYNVVLGNGTSHSFDMHGGEDRGDGTNIAGKRIDIYNNTFYEVRYPAPYFDEFQRSIVIRGIPTDGAYIHDNYLFYTNPDIDLLWDNSDYGAVPIVQVECMPGIYYSCLTYGKSNPLHFNVYNNNYNGTLY